MIKIYLAGPQVFYRDSAAIGAGMVAKCLARRMIGLYPADDEIIAEIDKLYARNTPGDQIADMIFTADVQKLDEADAVIACLTPFRGPEADPGTTWEMGYAYGKGKPVFAYDNDPRPYHDKVKAWNAADFTSDGPIVRDKNGDMVDFLGESANLMMTRSTTDKFVHSSFENALESLARFYGVE